MRNFFAADMKNTPLLAEEDYRAALRNIENLMKAERGTPEGDQLDTLVALVAAYESTHHPLGVFRPSLERVLTELACIIRLSLRLSSKREGDMQQVNIHDAKTHLSKLIEQTVTSGESFIIAKAGKPIVTVSAYTPPQNPAGRIGFLKGMIEVPKDFDCIGRDEIQAMFEGAE